MRSQYPVIDLISHFSSNKGTQSSLQSDLETDTAKNTLAEMLLRSVVGYIAVELVVI